MSNLTIDNFIEQFKGDLNEYQIKTLEMFGDINSIEITSVIVLPPEETYGKMNSVVRSHFHYRGDGIEGQFCFTFCI